MIYFAFLASHRVSQPLRRLGMIVSSLSLGGEPMTEELGDLKSRRDEIGRLASLFEELSTRLDQSFDYLSASIEEKETLLKELNHRVKNNLQIISSLVSTTASTCREEEDALRAGMPSGEDTGPGLRP